MANAKNPFDALVATYTSSVEKANALAERVAASKGNHAKSLKEYRDTDPREQEFREWLEKAQAAILAKVEEANARGAEVLGFSAPLTEDEIKSVKDEYAPHAEKARKAQKLLTEMSELMGMDVPELPELKRISGGKASGTAGATGIKRPRWDRVEVNGEEIRNGDKPGTLSMVAGIIKKATGRQVSAKDLQAAVFEAAGTDDMSKISDVEIGWSETVDGETHKWDIAVFKSHADGDDE